MNNDILELKAELKRNCIGAISAITAAILVSSSIAMATDKEHVAVHEVTVDSSSEETITIEESIVDSAVDQLDQPIPVEETSEPVSQYIDLGQFKITAYCHCVQCCGKSDGITASGAMVRANHTIAVDPNVIPLGSSVLIDGQVYVAEDTGGAIKGNRVDMYFATHQEALYFGIQYKNVQLIK